MFLPADEILTPRCRIAPLRLEHAPALRALTDSSVTARVDFLPSPFTLADATELIEASSQKDRFLGVESRTAAQLLGVVGAHVRPEQRIEIGYWFGAETRGRGYAAEAVGAVVTGLAKRFPDQRLFAECHPDNERSWALLRRLGFRETGMRGQREGRMQLAWKQPVSARIDVC